MFFFYRDEKNILKNAVRNLVRITFLRQINQERILEVLSTRLLDSVPTDKRNDVRQYLAYFKGLL